MSSINIEKRTITASFALITFATLVLFILILLGVPISPWWLLAPVLTPFALAAVGVVLLVASIITIILAIIIAAIVFFILLAICAIPIALTVLAVKLLDTSLSS